MNATDLLAEFRESRSEKAFGELVQRYSNLVYSVAKRRLSNGSLAEEVTQTVFIRLAKAVPPLRGDAELSAWLHRTTVHASIDLWRGETRRRAREEQAVVMQSDADDTTVWNELSPILDEALNELSDAERQTILLRFFEHKSMRELGVALGVSEDAAKMRVSRALDRLRGHVGNHGVTCGAVALGSMLTNRAVEAAPAALIAALMCLSLPVPVGVGASAGFFGAVLQVSRAKLMTGLAATVLIGVATLIVLRPWEQMSPIVVNDAPATNSPALAARPAAATPFAEVFEPDGTPNPLKLLQAVARARQRIGSGSMELQLTTEGLQNGHMETNQLRLSALFDGQKLRMEQVGREYRYTGMGDVGAAQDAKIKQEGLDRAAAVRTGLLQGFQARYVNAYDGAALLTHRETDGRSEGAVIDEPGRSAAFTFDPRCLGLATFLTAHSTIDACLGYNEARSIKLVGQEPVDGVLAWRVEVKSKHDATLEFWMDVAYPTHVLKHSSRGDTVVSKYDFTGEGHSLPMAVTSTMYRNGERYYGQRFIRSDTQFDVAVDPSSFTLAGLGMPVGTAVTDVRNHQDIRFIGYWNGAGLSTSPPGKGTEAPTPPDMGGLLAVLEYDFASARGLEAALWILLNTPDGPEVEKAAAVILRAHARDTNLVDLCRELGRVRHSCATNLLETILKENPSAQVRAAACFHLAALWKDAAKFGQNAKATAEAEKLFERVITEFARIGPAGAELARKAKPELYELRNLIIGKPAPETEGDDLDGQRINLRDYRGNVVVLFFWTASVASDVAELRKLDERMTGKPVALVGVNCNDDLSHAKSAVEKYEITWPTFWDEQSGPISTAWNVRGWLTTFVLNSKGVIRYRDVRGPELLAAVETLLKE